MRDHPRERAVGLLLLFIHRLGTLRTLRGVEAESEVEAWFRLHLAHLEAKLMPQRRVPRSHSVAQCMVTTIYNYANAAT